ncbi:MAG: DNA primase [Leptospirillia bacterium]
MQIPDDQIERVKAAADIVEVVSAHVPIQRKGQNHFGLCPFHSEKSPSFSVNAAKQIFHCFGCGEGGNVITFMMKMERLAFPEAVRHLADRYGVLITAGEDDGGRGRDDRERVKRVNEAAQSVFCGQVGGVGSDDTPARYLAERGLGADAVAAFELGWAADSWDGLTGRLRRSGLSEADLLLAGVTVKREDSGRVYDRFRGRLMFPIRSASGDLVGFGGRAIGDRTPKYLNSPETPLYSKSRVLYGLHQTKRRSGQLARIAVVEGYMDVIACHTHGVDWAVAPLGTALTEEHGRLLARFTNRVDLVFDGDAAGRAAARKAAAVLAPYPVEVTVVTLPTGEDPDSLARSEGSERLRERLTAGVPMMEFLLADCLNGHGQAPVERRLVAAQPVFDVLGRIGDPMRRGHYLGRVAEALGVRETDLSRHLKRGNPRRGPAGDDTATRRTSQPIPFGEALLLALALQEKVDAGWLCDRVCASAYTDPRARVVAEALEASVAAGNGVDGVVTLLQADMPAMGLVTGLMSRELALEGDAMVCAEECVADLMKKETREVGRRLLEDIRAAEANGDVAKVRALLEQKNALARVGQQIATG